MHYAVILRVRADATEALQARLREDEIRTVWAHHRAGTLLSIHFHDGPGALLIVDADDRPAAEGLAADLPMVLGGAAEAEVLELRPFTGYELLFRAAA